MEHSCQQANDFLAKGKYQQAAELYEKAIEAEPDIVNYYCYLGLAYLLQGHEEAAQAAWMAVIVQDTNEKIEGWINKLVQILDAEAQRQLARNDFRNSWLIRQHIREISPSDIENILYLIEVSIDLGEFTPSLLDEWQVTRYLKIAFAENSNVDLLLQVIKKLLNFHDSEVLLFIETCSFYIKPARNLVDSLISTAVKTTYQHQLPSFGIDIAKLCLRLEPENLEVLKHLSGFYTIAGKHQEAIEASKNFYSLCQSSQYKLLGTYLLIKAMISAGSWEEASPIVKFQKSLFHEIIQSQPLNLDLRIKRSLIAFPFFLPYFQDNIQENRYLQNHISQLFQKNIEISKPVVSALQFHQNQKKSIKIGYIAHTLRNHSVGWLCRWFFDYLNSELFQTGIYFVNQNLEEQSFFGEKVDFFHGFELNSSSIAEKIQEDQIDILVDLDSITLDVTCQVMALKPAPVQVTWLGWDASGIPAIDYFIADPYVLPENAQGYYSETIWRLPQTYIAVDGFEVGVPTLRRDQLEIPDDTVIYYSAQNGPKRHPDTVRLQMKIVKEVPNSYFLIKGLADETVIQQSFMQIAEEEGLDPGRLRFLQRDPNEFIHRANLGIADVVLDTYPYNGATTTLETLWMGIPLVTRVGQQFAARNSYAFMMNVGVTEGIAWTDEEYVEWGVRLGTDEKLRQQVAWKLRQSRQTSPLWNAKQFTREMEKAFQQMWARYVEGIRRI